MTVLHAHDGKVYISVGRGKGKVDRIHIIGREKSVFLLGDEVDFLPLKK